MTDSPPSEAASHDADCPSRDGLGITDGKRTVYPSMSKDMRECDPSISGSGPALPDLQKVEPPTFGQLTDALVSHARAEGGFGNKKRLEDIAAARLALRSHVAELEARMEKAHWRYLEEGNKLDAALASLARLQSNSLTDAEISFLSGMGNPKDHTFAWGCFCVRCEDLRPKLKAAYRRAISASLPEQPK